MTTTTASPTPPGMTSWRWGWSMDIQTHQDIDAELCGAALELREGFSRVRLETTLRMAVDEPGLVHGGFIFGLADYAAMIAVNHPSVVLGGANVKFLKPVNAGEVVVAEAAVRSANGRKRSVDVICRRGEERVFEGEFACFVLDRHVLG